MNRYMTSATTLATKLLAIAAALVLMALVGAGTAHAQTTPVNESGFECGPRAGMGWKFGLTIAPQGGWWSWWCLGTDSRWHLRVHAQPAADMITLAGPFSDVMNAPDYSAAIKDFRAKYPAANRLATDADIKPIWVDSLPAMLAAKPVDPVPPVVTPPKVYVVAPNGTAKTRQWYPFAAGVGRTSTAGGGSVTIAGTACKPDVASVTEGAVLYAAFGPSFRADRVTACVAQ